MKTKSFLHKPPIATLLAVWTSLAVGLVACKSNAQVTLIDFDNIPPYPALVDSFGRMFPGLTLAGGDQWLADSVGNSFFQYIQNRSISTFGMAPLWISFDTPAQDVTVDLGSGQLGVTLTIGITGYRGGQLVFMDSFVTHAGPGGGDEVRAFTIGTVDQIVVAKTAGNALLTLDNLSFATVPEPGALALLALGGLVVSLRCYPVMAKKGRR